MPKRPVLYFFLFLFVGIFIFSLAVDLPRRQNGGFFSDESSYFAIIQSLAFDGDLQYTRNDIERIKENFWVGPTGLFLKQAKNGNLYYAKSFVYPLFAAPFFRLLGVRGILLFNGLLLFSTILLSYLLLHRDFPDEKSLSFSLIFLLSSVTWVYIWWITADLFNFALVFAGLFFFFYPFRKSAWFYGSGFFFALAVFSKPSNAAPIGIILLILLYQKKGKRFILLAGLMASILAGLAYFNYSQTGELIFMAGERKSFAGNFPFEKPQYSFASAPSTRMTADNYWQRFYLNPQTAMLNLFYYFFGRFTGMLLYFPVAFFLLILFFFQKKIPEDWFLLAAIAVYILGHVLLGPDNYFGGSGSLGNRYFLNVFPLFFFLGYRHRLHSLNLVPVFLAVLFLAPVFLDSHQYSAFPRLAGMNFPLNLFPPEKTQFASLPSNENPRGFYRSIGDRFWLFFLNDNFNNLEGDFFWTYGDKRLELFLLSPAKIRELRVELTASPAGGRILFAVEQQRKRVVLGPTETGLIRFTGIPGLRVSRRYLYHLTVQCDRAYCPYFRLTDSEDKRLLGVKTRIEPVY